MVYVAIRIAPQPRVRGGRIRAKDIIALFQRLAQMRRNHIGAGHHGLGLFGHGFFVHTVTSIHCSVGMCLSFHRAERDAAHSKYALEEGIE